MTPERWKRIEELYHAAHAKSQDQRAAFLSGACHDDEELRRQVESLLNESESDDGFLAEPPLVLPAHMVSELAPAVMTGRTLGGYQLQTLIGAGGMGEVYRARDPKLDRDVAIKILPRAFTSDPDRLARFEREARVLAALNHPNICGIYGLEEADGIRFLILELVATAKHLPISSHTCRMCTRKARDYQSVRRCSSRGRSRGEAPGVLARLPAILQELRQD
jgi:hypothetical protein